MSRLTVILASPLSEKIRTFRSYSSVENLKIIVQFLLWGEKYSLLAWPVTLFVMVLSCSSVESLLLTTSFFFHIQRMASCLLLEMGDTAS